MNDNAGTPPADVTLREVAQRLYAAISRGDAATINELIHPQAVLSVPGHNPVSGSYRGRPGFRRFIEETAAIAPGGARTDVIEIMGAGRHAAVYGVSRGARSGRPPLENRTVHILTVEDGRVSSITVFNLDQYAVDDFWS